MFFYPAVLDTNGKMATFFHHKEFLKEISFIQYQDLVKFKRNRCKIIIFEFPFTTETLNLKWNQIECGKIEKSDHFTASHKTFCFPSFLASLKASIAIFFEGRFCASFEEKTLRNDISSSYQLWWKLQNIHFTNGTENGWKKTYTMFNNHNRSTKCCDCV